MHAFINLSSFFRRKSVVTGPEEGDLSCSGCERHLYSGIENLSFRGLEKNLSFQVVERNSCFTFLYIKKRRSWRGCPVPSKVWTRGDFTCVWIQLMGSPTYWEVVTITENVRRMRLEIHQWSRNTLQGGSKLGAIIFRQMALSNLLLLSSSVYVQANTAVHCVQTVGS